MSERKCPVYLYKGGFSERIYAARRYSVAEDGLMTVHDKDDVTQSFYNVAAELWPQLIADGSLKPVGSGGGAKPEPQENNNA